MEEELYEGENRYNLAHALRLKRKKYKLTLKQVANLSGLNAKGISLIEDANEMVSSIYYLQLKLFYSNYEKRI